MIILGITSHSNYTKNKQQGDYYVNKMYLNGN